MPTHSKTGYECILGSIEMGYHVNGFLLINQDTLINSWNFKGLDPESIWHGNEHATAISNDNLANSPHSEKIMKSSIGILNAFEFLEEVSIIISPITFYHLHVKVHYSVFNVLL